MANDYRDRYRNDRLRGHDRYDRFDRGDFESRLNDEPSRGMFGYEGEGFMYGRGRDTDFGLGMDSARPNFRGIGPKNYERSDDRIREDVCERLSQDEYVDAHDIDVAVSGGIVTLSGTIDERGSKRRAEDIAESVGGVRDVQNQLRLAQQPDARDTTGSEGGGTKMPRTPRR